MNIDTQLKQLSIKEKLLVMETLWDDLCHQQEDLTSPNWHKQILQEREHNASEKSQFVDWELAKSNLRNSIK